MTTRKGKTIAFEYKTVPKAANRNQIEAALPLLQGAASNLSRKDLEALAASLYETMIDVAEPLQFPDKLTDLQARVLREFTMQAIGKKRTPYIKDVARALGESQQACNEAFQALVRKRYVIKLSHKQRRNKFKVNIAPE